MLHAPHQRRSATQGPGAPRWEPIARLAIRLSRGEPVGDENLAAAAAELVQACRGNDVLLREALAVFASGAERGPIGRRAAASLRLAIRQLEERQEPFRGVRLRGRRRARPTTPSAPTS